MRQRTSDILSGSFLLGLSIVLYIYASGIEARLPVGLDSGVFPGIASVLLAIFASVVVIRAWTSRGEDDDQIAVEFDGILSVFRTFVLIVLYVIMVPVAGFLLATAIFLPLQFFALSRSGERRWVMFVVVSLVATGLVYSAFAYGFQVILPRGRLF